MSASLIDRVRERLAAEAVSSVPLRPNVVADAIRGRRRGKGAAAPTTLRVRLDVPELDL